MARSLSPFCTRSLAIAALLALASACRGTSTDDAPVRQYTVADLFKNVTFTGASFSADKSRILVSSDASGVYNAYAIPTGGGDPVPMTNSTTDAVLAVSYFPEDDRILYMSGQPAHLHVREVDGTVVDLTPGAKVRAEFHGWAHDLKSFFVATNERDPRYFDLYEYGVYQYKRRPVYRNSSGLVFGPVSRDKRYLALMRHNGAADSDVLVYEIPTRATKLLTAHDGRARHFPQDFTPDSRSLLITTDEGSDFMGLRAYDIGAGTNSVLLAPPWDVEHAAFSYHGKYVTARVNEDSRPRVRVYDAATMNEDSIPGFPEGLVSSVVFSRDDKTYAAYAGDGRAPPELFVANVGFNARRLTTTLSDDVKREDLVTPEVVHFRARDSVDIPGVLYRPRAATARRRAPAVVMVHGGPGAQATAEYSALAQALANHGYLVLDVNTRGSSGYGARFVSLDDRRDGRAHASDVVAAKRMLIGTGVVDSARIGIIGTSRSGVPALAPATLRPNEFTAAVLVHQGAGDPDGFIAETDDLVATAKRNGVTVERVVLQDDGHGVTKANAIRAYTALITFLDQHLMGTTAKQ